MTMVEISMLALLTALVVYAQKVSFTIGNGNIYLPKEVDKRFFFDSLNEKHPQLFRSISAIGAFITIIGSHIHYLLSIIIGLIFLIPYLIYTFTCIRSYYLIKTRFSEYYED